MFLKNNRATMGKFSDTFLYILFVFLLISVVTVEASQLVVLQSSRVPPFEEVSQAFLKATVSSVSKWGLKNVNPDSHINIVLSEQAANVDILAKIDSYNPSLIVAVGRPALLHVMHYTKAPIIHLLVPFPPAALEDNPNIVGIDMNVPVARQLTTFVAAIPSISSIGVIYNPDQTGDLVAQARDFSFFSGVEIVAEKATTPKEALQAIPRLQGKVAAIWMLPDTSLLTPGVIEGFLRFSIKNRLPLLSFADKYVAMGATMSVSANLLEMGARAGRLARKILDNQGFRLDIDNYQYSDSISVQFNEMIAQKIGLRVNTAVLQGLLLPKDSDSL